MDQVFLDFDKELAGLRRELSQEEKLQGSGPCVVKDTGPDKTTTGKKKKKKKVKQMIQTWKPASLPAGTGTNAASAIKQASVDSASKSDVLSLFDEFSEGSVGSDKGNHKNRVKAPERPKRKPQKPHSTKVRSRVVAAVDGPSKPTVGPKKKLVSVKTPREAVIKTQVENEKKSLNERNRILKKQNELLAKQLEAQRTANRATEREKLRLEKETKKRLELEKKQQEAKRLKESMEQMRDKKNSVSSEVPSHRVATKKNGRPRSAKSLKKTKKSKVVKTTAGSPGDISPFPETKQILAEPLIEQQQKRSYMERWQQNWSVLDEAPPGSTPVHMDENDPSGDEAQAENGDIDPKEEVVGDTNTHVSECNEKPNSPLGVPRANTELDDEVSESSSDETSSFSSSFSGDEGLPVPDQEQDKSVGDHSDPTQEATSSDQHNSTLVESGKENTHSLDQHSSTTMEHEEENDSPVAEQQAVYSSGQHESTPGEPEKGSDAPVSEQQPAYSSPDQHDSTLAEPGKENDPPAAEQQVTYSSGEDNSTVVEPEEHRPVVESEQVVKQDEVKSHEQAEDEMKESSTVKCDIDTQPPETETVETSQACKKSIQAGKKAEKKGQPEAPVKRRPKPAGKQPVNSKKKPAPPKQPVVAKTAPISVGQGSAKKKVPLKPPGTKQSPASSDIVLDDLKARLKQQLQGLDFKSSIHHSFKMLREADVPSDPDHQEAAIPKPATATIVVESKTQTKPHDKEVESKTQTKPHDKEIPRSVLQLGENKSELSKVSDSITNNLEHITTGFGHSTQDLRWTPQMEKEYLELCTKRNKAVAPQVGSASPVKPSSPPLEGDVTKPESSPPSCLPPGTGEKKQENSTPKPPPKRAKKTLWVPK
mmetsp:Transcript_11114/g.20628  ORF Transcript_11114/g.20628 Transcript_11114/m.20628 type:complete len:877 (+) Transcript_11114:249-2879(+)